MKRTFEHSTQIWADFPTLVPGVVLVHDITSHPDVTSQTDALAAMATDRLEVSTEATFPEVQAWRHAFTQMGLKPTQYRCASEALLRRYRKEGSLPRLHPLVDLCNAASIAFAIPVAALDVDHIAGDLQVRYATGDERFASFSGETEHPEPGEVVFVDSASQAHARRWSHRQGRVSAVSADTTTALIVAEAHHNTGPADIRTLQTLLTDALAATWDVSPLTTVLSMESASFTYEH
jgi:DNA/RNA-binding domain of Phe-tRNA-synthetase-like protein